MAFLKLATVAFLAFSPLLVSADFSEAMIENIEELPDDDTGTTPAGMGMVKVMAQASFPDSDVFGVKLVNGKPSKATLQVINAEDDAVTVRLVGGSLWPLDTRSDTMNMDSVIRNLTSAQYNVVVPPTSNITLDYQFTTELHPQDLQLVLAAIVESKTGTIFQVDAFNATVSVVEAPLSILDPQMLFLYAFIGSILAGTVYFIYNTWVKTFFPQQKKRSTRKPVTTAPASSVDPNDSASTTGATKSYDASWIQAQHLQRPEAKRVRSGTPKTRAK